MSGSTVGKMKEKRGSALLTLYLTLYNLTSCAGWVYLLSITCRCFLDGDARPDEYWSKVGMPLKLVQTAAVLEIAHSVTGVVKSPLMTTFLQVFSRIWVTWAVLAVSPSAYESVFCYLTITSWCCVEIPRYMFYALNQFDRVPYFLFWLRYSLFAVLYPTGITGELACTYLTAVHLFREQHQAVDPMGLQVLLFGVVFLALSYIPGAPTMYKHMVKTRKKQFSSYRGFVETKAK